MGIFRVRIIEEFENNILIEADSAEEAGEMVRQRDFSYMVDDPYDENLNEHYIRGVQVYDKETGNKLLAIWDTNKD